MGLLNLADWVDCTEVEGPGRRAALWVQGCTLRCQGCCNPHMMEIEPRYFIKADRVITWLHGVQNRHAIEGVTFLGGEPMLQARGLAEVASACRGMGLSVIVFTGFTIEWLHEFLIPGAEQLLAETDVLVDGPYIAEMRETARNWVGSNNQRFHFLTSRYTPEIVDDPTYAHGFELRVLRDGTIKGFGWPND